MSFFRSPRMWKSQGERSVMYGGCWSVSQPHFLSLFPTRLAVYGRALSCKRMIPSDSIPERSDFIARRRTLSHQEKSTSLLFFHFQFWTNRLYTTLTSRTIKKQLCGPVRFHYACLLPYKWQYRYATTVLSDFARNVFYGGCAVFIWLHLKYMNNFCVHMNFSKLLNMQNSVLLKFNRIMQILQKVRFRVSIHSREAGTIAVKNPTNEQKRFIVQSSTPVYTLHGFIFSDKSFVTFKHSKHY